MTNSKKDSELRHEIHMLMLAKSKNAKDCGDLTVVPLGFAVDVTLQTINSKYITKEESDRRVLEGRIEELGKFMDAITENEAEREMRGEDCIESRQWQRLCKMSDFRIAKLRELLKGDKK